MIEFCPENESHPPAFVSFRHSRRRNVFKKLDFYDCLTGEVQRTIEIGGWVFAVSPDGRRLAAGIYDVTIVEIDTGEVVKALPKTGGVITALEFSPDGQELFIKTESDTRDLHLFDIESGTKLWTVAGNSVNGPPGIGQFAVGPKGKWVAVHFMTPLQEVWLVDVETGERVRRMDTGNSFIWDLEFSPNGKLLASADFEGYATLWETDEGNIRLRLRAATGQMRRLGFTSDNCLVTFSRDSSQPNSQRRLQLWELSNGTEIDSRIGISPTTTTFALNPDNGSVLISGTPSTLWRFPIETPVFSIESAIPGVVGFLGDDFLICPARGQQRSLAIFDLRAPGKPEVRWTMNDSRASSRLAVNFRQDSALVYGTSDRKYHRIGFSGNEDTPGEIEPPAFSPPTFMMQFAQTSNRLLSIENSKQRDVLVLDMDHKEPLASLAGPVGSTCIATAWVNRNLTALGLYHEDSNSYTSNDVLYCWNVATKEIEKRIQFSSAMYALATSKDGRHFAVAGQDRSIEIYDSRSLQRILRFRSHDAPVRTLTFHPTLPLIASGSDDLSIRIWNVESGTLLKTFLGPTRTVRSLDFNTSGSLLACNSSDHATRVWKVDGQQLLDSAHHKGQIKDVLVAPSYKPYNVARTTKQSARTTKF